MDSLETSRQSRPSVVPSFQVVPLSELLAVARDWSHGHAHHRMAAIPETTPGRITFGPLQLFAMEKVSAGHGYALHSHANVEIVSIVLDGTVLHRDSIDGESALGAEMVAVASAGRAFEHSDYAGPDGAARMIQIQLESRSRDVIARAAHAVMPRAARRGCFRVLASGRAEDAESGALWIDQDAAISSAVLEAGECVEYRVKPGRAAYLLPVDAPIVVYGSLVRAGERAIIRSPGVIAIEACGSTEVVLLDG